MTRQNTRACFAAAKMYNLLIITYTQGKYQIVMQIGHSFAIIYSLRKEYMFKLFAVGNLNLNAGHARGNVTKPTHEMYQ